MGELFRYYTSFKFNVTPADWQKVGNKADEIMELAEQDVENERKPIRSANSFKNNSEYQIYLFAVNDAAWLMKNKIKGVPANE